MDFFTNKMFCVCADECFRHVAFHSTDWRRTVDTRSWWTSCRLTTRGIDTHIIGAAGWWPERRIRRRQPGSTSIRIHLSQANSSESRSSPSKKSSSLTMTWTDMGMWVYYFFFERKVSIFSSCKINRWIALNVDSYNNRYIFCSISEICQIRKKKRKKTEDISFTYIKLYFQTQYIWIKWIRTWQFSTYHFVRIIFVLPVNFYIGLL